MHCTCSCTVNSLHNFHCTTSHSCSVSSPLSYPLNQFLPTTIFFFVQKRMHKKCWASRSDMFRRNDGCHFLILMILLCNHCGCGADDEALRLLLKGNELVGQDPPRHLEAIASWRSFALCNVAFSSASAISHRAKTASVPQFASFHTHKQARYLKKCSRERLLALHNP